MTLKGDHIAEEFQALLDAYVRRTFGDGGSGQTDQRHPAIANDPKVIPILAV